MLGFLAWLAYRPQAENSADHVMSVFQLPWTVIGISMALAAIATYFAAAGATTGGSGQNQGMLELVVGFVTLTVAIVLLAPACLSAVAAAGKWSPIAIRLALRDLARYRARSGPALAAISLSTLIAVIICVASAARFGNVLDYAGPNLSSNQLIVYEPGNGNGRSAVPDNNPTAAQIAAVPKVAKDIAAALGTTSLVPLETSNANLDHAANGRSWSGQVYVATPQLLSAFGIKQSEINPDADILTMRPGLSTMSLMQLAYGNQQGGGQIINGRGTAAETARETGPTAPTSGPARRAAASPTRPYRRSASSRPARPRRTRWSPSTRSPHCSCKSRSRLPAGPSRCRTASPPRRSPKLSGSPRRPAWAPKPATASRRWRRSLTRPNCSGSCSRSASSA